MSAIREKTALVIEPRSGLRKLDFRELWRFRELLGFLALRDVKVRYKQTVLGVLWVALQPLLAMVVLSLVFGRLAKLPPEGMPSYPLFVFSGLVPWLFFANAVSNAAQSLVGSANLLTKIYFPRVLVPTAAVTAGLADVAVSLLLMLGLAAWSGVTPRASWLLLPPLLFLVWLAALGSGVLLAALTVSYRDFRYVVPFLIQIWMFATPVAYAASLVPPKWKWLLVVNPMATVITGFRAALVGAPIDPTPLALSSALVVAVAAAAILYFQSVEGKFADVV